MWAVGVYILATDERTIYMYSWLLCKQIWLCGYAVMPTNCIMYMYHVHLRQRNRKLNSKLPVRRASDLSTVIHISNV